MLFSESVPQSVWDELPANLKREITTDISSFRPQMTRRRMDYDL